ncbi:AAA family ATPase [Pajaroellobacter abortibovis]|uniref:Clp R domain-containing protein n=1 Tax=Pajaroellobacter abortibovis TaxID=1882918 RepID=A0A1L6MZ08_9BACT|nr:ATP-dependent Clp protease ATP-binding subunit [Pajaroellobacter abortibovis]APS00719.1 hypothetical protein BCY86_08535 [Pajaroellobacter abortibovis]
MKPNESEIDHIQERAYHLAKRRQETLTTVHLLAALLEKPSHACDLLRERKVEIHPLLEGAKKGDVQENPDTFQRLIKRSQLFAMRSPVQKPGAIHVLFSLCQARNSIAYLILERHGIDITKLRTAAMQLALGLVGPRRFVTIPGEAHTASINRVYQSTLSSPLAHSPKDRCGKEKKNPSSVSPIPRSGSPSPAPPSAHPPTLSPRKPASSTRPVIQRKMMATSCSLKPHANRFSLDPKCYPLLNQLGKNLTLAAASGQLDQVVGRQREIEKVLDILAKREGNNPCLIGPPGVGKTSIVRGVAFHTAFTSHPLDERILIEVTIPALLAGTGMRGSLIEKLAQLKLEVQRGEGKIILFFDDMHSLFEEANEEGLCEFKVALSQREFACISATTEEQYRRILEEHAGLTRRFTAVEIEAPSSEQALDIIQQVSLSFATYHQVQYPSESLKASVQWSSRYLSDRALPDQAISLLDLAGARARRKGLSQVQPEQIAEIVSEVAGVPNERLLETDHDRLLRVAEVLARRIVGHYDAIQRIAAVLRRHGSGLQAARPIGSFLLLGPTGIGKTEMAKAIAEFLFGSPYALTHLDLSEYAESHSIARLIGSPPGYIGHEAGGQLTSAVRRRPYQVILLDEMEKAHRDVLELFLPVLDEGRLTDGQGRTVNFTNTVLILTSNLGSEVALPAQSKGRMGFLPSAQDMTRTYTDQVIASAKSALPPELFNRFDEILALAPLTRKDVAEIAKRMLTSLIQEIERVHRIHLQVDPQVIEILLDAGGFDQEMGARPMRRTLSRLIEAPIAEMLLQKKLPQNSTLHIREHQGQLAFSSSAPPNAL